LTPGKVISMAVLKTRTCDEQAETEFELDYLMSLTTRERFEMMLRKLPAQHMWLDYDKEADVLYVSFRKPQRDAEAVELDDDILVRKDGTEIVGLTIVNASSEQTRPTGESATATRQIAGAAHLLRF